jgi:hypothetical protein
MHECLNSVSAVFLPLTMNVIVSALSFVFPIPYSIPYAVCPTCKRASRGLDPIDVQPHLESVRAGCE